MLERRAARRKTAPSRTEGKPDFAPGFACSNAPGDGIFAAAMKRLSPSLNRTRRASGALAAAVLALAGHAAGVAPGPFQPTWTSLEQHRLPAWVQDAKFGLYGHWGLYAVPAFGNEWYARNLYNPKSAVHREHVRRYGPLSKFGYKDFIPLFTAKDFDPDAWATLARKSGAKFAGLAMAHHDGFGLWDSDVYEWNVGKKGPKRDLFGEYAAALRRQGLKVVSTFHMIRGYTWWLPDEAAIAQGRREGWDLFAPRYKSFYLHAENVSRDVFLRQWRARIDEVVAKYHPDLLWFDGGDFRGGDAEGTVLEMLANYLNRAAARHQEVAVLNKLPTTLQFNFPESFGMLTFENGRDRPLDVPRPWLDDMRIGSGSWGYLEGQTYWEPNFVIDSLVDRVARGGGLILSLSPKADGTIPAGQQELLLAVGNWLKINGEAIYATRRWAVDAEGPLAPFLKETKDKRGQTRRRWNWKQTGPEDHRFTRSKDGRTVYALTLGWPGDEVSFAALGKKSGHLKRPIASVSLLGAQRPSRWRQSDEALTIDLRGVEPPTAHAHAWRIELAR